jgi:hypothetical protein
MSKHFSRQRETLQRRIALRSGIDQSLGRGITLSFCPGLGGASVCQLAMQQFHALPRRGKVRPNLLSLALGFVSLADYVSEALRQIRTVICQFANTPSCRLQIGFELIPLNLNVLKGSFLDRCLRFLCLQQSGDLLVLDPDLVQLGSELFGFFKRSLEWVGHFRLRLLRLHYLGS